MLWGDDVSQVFAELFFCPLMPSKKNQFMQFMKGVMWGATLRHSDDIWNHFQVWKLLWWVLLYVSGAIYSIITFSPSHTHTHTHTHTRRALNMSYWKRVWIIKSYEFSCWSTLHTVWNTTCTHSITSRLHADAKCTSLTFDELKAPLCFFFKLPSELLRWFKTDS